MDYLPIRVLACKFWELVLTWKYCTLSRSSAESLMRVIKYLSHQQCATTKNSKEEECLIKMTGQNKMAVEGFLVTST